jgi:hypothetical protein
MVKLYDFWPIFVRSFLTVDCELQAGKGQLVLLCWSQGPLFQQLNLKFHIYIVKVYVGYSISSERFHFSK